MQLMLPPTATPNVTYNAPLQNCNCLREKTVFHFLIHFQLFLFYVRPFEIFAVLFFHLSHFHNISNQMQHTKITVLRHKSATEEGDELCILDAWANALTLRASLS